MAEYLFVYLPAKSGKTKSAEIADSATFELNRDYVTKGWQPVSIAPGGAVGQVGFLLARG